MEERLFYWPPPEGVDPASIGVALYRGDGGWLHIGALYGTAAGPQMLSHWGHRHAKNTPLEPGWLCVLCDIDAARFPIVAAAFRRILKAVKDRVPFGFSDPLAGWFTAEGGFQVPHGAIGLCCQSFVIALFDAAGLPLVDRTPVPVRADDAADQQGFLNFLQPALNVATPENQLHYATLPATVPQPLLRPEEVAGAAWSGAYPCDFETAHRLGQVVLARL